MTRIIITGAKGRMGQMLVNCAVPHPELRVVGQVDLGDRLSDFIKESDVVIDFSFHDAVAGVLETCLNESKALVIGTTGHSTSEREMIRAAGKSIPIVWASNYSVGVNILFWLTRKVAERIPDFDLEIVEMHHRMKKDAPSGTATTLAEILAEVRGVHLDEAARHGREGIVGERTKTEIGIHSLRGGDVVGDHTVIFANNGERLELTHKASSRETFADGALRAAGWVSGREPGIYDMQDVLGLKQP